MIKQNLIDKIKLYFPDFQISYKDESTFMKVLSYFLFFNPAFTKSFTTTIGSTVYFPSKQFLSIRPISSLVILLHELVHVHDQKRYSNLLFSLAYLFPACLVPLFLPLLFISLWALIPIILCALPFTAYFRMKFELRAYLTSLYVAYHITNNKEFTFNIDQTANYYKSYFKNSAYYYMWPFSLNKQFSTAIININNDQHPFQDDDLFFMIDLLLKNIE